MKTIGLVMIVKNEARSLYHRYRLGGQYHRDGAKIWGAYFTFRVEG